MRLDAPFTADQVASLTEYQDASAWHPFTCVNDHTGDRELIPTRTGWVCPHCKYIQSWCYTWMANWEWKADAEAVEEVIEANSPQ